MPLILAGCGGSSAPKQQWQTVHGPGYRFEAPLGWKIATRAGMTTASVDSELEQVATFPLVHPYSPALFTKVEPELAATMGDVAKKTAGTVSGHRIVTAAGIKSHAYDVTVGDHVDEYTFVLRGKREYQLLCRRKSTDKQSFCEQLVASFAVA